MLPPFSLGPFELQAPLATGGMSQVWEGVHRARGLPVAIKLLAPTSDSRDWAATFRHEVRAAARLHHPNIVCLLDHGELPANLGIPGLPERAAYLVMERADSTLDAVASDYRWPAIHAVLIRLLEALAHAHARGVVHCDVKASNVLLGGLRPGPKLSDFGIARAAFSSGPNPGRRVGTPSHMAPEQFTARCREIGPWTDLYAVGCMTWKLATGRTPFRGSTWGELREAHSEQSLPPFVPRMEVPRGLEAWLRLLLVKEPSARIDRAADAARQLKELPFGPTRRRPVVPATWRLPSDGALANRDLQGVGLGLFGLRRVPMVGRVAERDRLWGELQQVVQTQQPRVVALRGEAGVGRGRLVRWLAERAHELGVAESVQHAPAVGHSDTLRGVMTHTLRCEGLDLAQTRVHLRTWLDLTDPSEIDAIASLITGTGPARPTTSEHRAGVAIRVLERLARRGCVVLCFDGPGNDADAEAFVRQLLGVGTIPVLVLWTPGAGHAVPAMDPRIVTLDVAPLDISESEAVVRATIGLQPDLTRRLAGWMRGSPMLAVELIRGWVDQGQLRVTADGYVLDPAAVPPSDPRTLWGQRLMQTCGVAALPGLEVAAALGPDVYDSVWRAACAELGVQPLGVEALLGAGLARGTETQWKFAHPVFVEALSAAAASAGRWRDVHLACATVQDDAASRGLHLADAGRPIEAAGALLEAVRGALAGGRVRTAGRLLEAWSEVVGEVTDDHADPRWVDGWLAQIGVARLQGHLHDAERLADGLLSRSSRYGWDAVEAQAHVARAMVRQAAGRLEAAAYDVRCALAQSDDPATRASAQLQGARIALDSGGPGAAEAAQQALAHYRSQGDPQGAGEAHTVLAREAIRRGAPDDAVRAARDGVDCMRGASTLVGLADALGVLGEAQRQVGNLTEAEASYDEAQSLLLVSGSWDGWLLQLNRALLDIDRGDTTRARSRLEGALSELAPRPQMAGALHAYLLPCVARDGEWDMFAKHLSVAASSLHDTGFVDPDVARLAELAAVQAELAGHPELAAGARGLVTDQQALPPG